MAEVDIKTEQILVTPEMAAAWLKLNTGNRKLSQKRVDTYAAAINRGEWCLTHQGIAISNTDRLLDGQHRLEAVVKAGEPIYLLVTTGIDEKAFIAMDVGRIRSFADALRMSNNDVAICRMILDIADGRQERRGMWTTKEVADCYAIFKSRIDGLWSFSATRKKGRASTPILIAIIARMIKHPESYKWIGDQWKYFSTLEVDKFSAGTKSLLKQLDTGKTHLYHPGELAARTFLAFDPKLSRATIKVHDVAEVLQQMREVFLKFGGPELPKTTTPRLLGKKPFKRRSAASTSSAAVP